MKNSEFFRVLYELQSLRYKDEYRSYKLFEFDEIKLRIVRGKTSDKRTITFSLKPITSTLPFDAIQKVKELCDEYKIHGNFNSLEFNFKIEIDIFPDK